MWVDSCLLSIANYYFWLAVSSNYISLLNALKTPTSKFTHYTCTKALMSYTYSIYSINISVCADVCFSLAIGILYITVHIFPIMLL